MKKKGCQFINVINKLKNYKKKSDRVELELTVQGKTFGIPPIFEEVERWEKEKHRSLNYAIQAKSAELIEKKNRERLKSILFPFRYGNSKYKVDKDLLDAGRMPIHGEFTGQELFPLGLAERAYHNSMNTEIKLPKEVKEKLKNLTSMNFKEKSMEIKTTGKEGIHIEQVHNGYVANVGCKTITFNKLDDLLEGIKLYYTDEEKAKKKYLTMPLKPNWRS